MLVCGKCKPAVFCLTRLELFKLNFPTATKGFVEGDEVEEGGGVAVEERLLGVVELPLSIEKLDQANKSFGLSFMT